MSAASPAQTPAVHRRRNCTENMVFWLLLTSITCLSLLLTLAGAKRISRDLAAQGGIERNRVLALVTPYIWGVNYKDVLLGGNVSREGLEGGAPVCIYNVVQVKNILT